MQLIVVSAVQINTEKDAVGKELTFTNTRLESISELG